MANLETLDTLIEIAQDRRTHAAQLFAQAAERFKQGQERASILENYRQEYEVQLHQESKHGMGGAQVGNFMRFINQLSNAIEQQHLDNQQLERTQEKAREAFLVEERKLQSFQVLAKRELDKQMQVENKRDQRLNDEYANRSRTQRPV